MNVSTNTEEDLLQATLNEEKFQILKPYFYGFNINDLGILYAENLIEDAKKIHKLKMRLLVHRLKPYFQIGCPDDYYNESSLFHNSNRFEIKKFVVVDHLFDLSDKITSSNFSDFMQNRISIEKLSLQIESDNVSMEDIQFVNMKNCDLLDEDMVYIRNFIESLPSNDLCLNLSKNRLYGIHTWGKPSDLDQHLRAILQNNHIRFVDITVNNLASCDRRDLFHEILTSEELGKLIWIPKMWLNHNDWKNNMVPESMFDIVIQTHNDYYKNWEHHFVPSINSKE